VACFGWVSPCYWLDIGNPAKYRQAQVDLLAGRIRSAALPAGPAAGTGQAGVPPGATMVQPVSIGRGTRIEIGARVGPDVVLGRDCLVGAGARVAGAVAWEQVEIGPGATLSDCVIGARVRIGRGATVGPGAVLESDRIVPEGARVGA
jgi:NDP-sugar pyrophosphorylase family protein